MKKYLAGIAALALAIGIVVTGCQPLIDALKGIDTENDNDKDKEQNDTVTNTFTQGDYNYVLVFYDETYVLIGTSKTTGGKITSTGTFSESGGVKTLIPDGGTAADRITVSSGNGGKVIVEIAGDIPFKDQDDNTVENPLGEGSVDAEDTTSGVSETNAQVYYEDGLAYLGSVPVYIELHDESTDEYTYLEAGSITGGKLTLKLPASVDDKYLVGSAAFNEQYGDQVTVTPASVKIGSGVLYIYYNDEYRYLYYEKETEDGYSDIMYMYFSEAAKATGSYSGSEEGYSYTVNININGTRGWNRIYSSGTKTSTGYTQTVTSDLSKASGLKWYVDIDSVEDKETGKDDQGGSGVSETNAQVYNGDGSAYSGNDTVYIEVYNEITKESTYLEAGSITGGKLTFSLPETIDEKYLAGYAGEYGDQITMSPASAKGGVGNLYIFYGGGYRYLFYGKETKDELSGIGYMYLSEAAKITGTYIGSEEGYSFTMTYDVNGTKGWNRILFSGTETDTGYTETYTSELSEVSGFKWYVYLDSSRYENGEQGDRSGETATSDPVPLKKVFSR